MTTVTTQGARDLTMTEIAGFNTTLRLWVSPRRACSAYEGGVTGSSLPESSNTGTSACSDA